MYAESVSTTSKEWGIFAAKKLKLKGRVNRPAASKVCYPLAYMIANDRWELCVASSLSSDFIFLMFTFS